METTGVLHPFKCLVLLIAAGIIFPQPLCSQATVDPGLSNFFEKSENEAEVIVTFRGEGPPNIYQVNILEYAGIETGLIFQSLPIAGVLATKTQIEELAAHEEVLSLWHNTDVVFENNASTKLTGVNKLRNDPDMTARNDGIPVTGKGIGVLINDSGVDGLHPDVMFGQNLIQNVEGATNLRTLHGMAPVTYIEGQPKTDNISGHGTHVAGTAGGTGDASNGRFSGNAPGADIVGYGSGAVAFLLDVLGAFDYAIANSERYNIRVLNNSWGTIDSEGEPFNPAHPVTIASWIAYQHNITVVFSAGNSGPQEHSITGGYKKAPWVITVAASDKNKMLANYSSRGNREDSGTFEIQGEIWSVEDHPNITAPGTNVVSARAHDDPDMYDSNQEDVFYSGKTGTSMAAPQISGIVALLLEVNPHLDPLDVKRILEETAEPLTGRVKWEAGAGFIDAYAAVAKAFEDAEQYPTHGGRDVEIPSDFQVFQNHPNPFNPVTAIRYELPVAGEVNIVVFDLMGRKVKTLVEGSRNAGYHEAHFDASGLSSGIYMYRFSAGDFVETRKMLLVQ